MVALVCEARTSRGLGELGSGKRGIVNELRKKNKGHDSLLRIPRAGYSVKVPFRLID
jgi:hypothetical protein